MNKRSRKLRSLVCVGASVPLAALLGPSIAAAEPGDHINVGQAEITPTLQLAGEFQTNAYLEDGSAGNEADAGLALRVRPATQIAVSSNDLSLSAGAGWTIRQYLTPGMSNLNHYSDFDVLVGLNALPRSVVGFKLTEDLRNRSRAADVGNNDDPNALVPDDANLKRLSNQTLGQLAIHPGGALSVDVGGHFVYDRYTFPEGSVNEGESDANSKLGFGPDIGVQWRFFPKTAVVVDFTAESYNWTPNARTSSTGAVTGVPDGFMFQATGGLKGRITDKVQVALMAGYGQLSADETTVTATASGVTIDTDELAQDLKGFPDGLLALAELTYEPAKTQKISLGVRKEFSDVYFTNYVDYVNLFGRYEGRYFDKLRVLGELTFRTEDYVGDISRKDNYLRGRVDLGWQIATFLDLAGGVVYAGRTNTDGTAPQVNYDDVTVVFGATFTY